jgi:hypothetical protein
VKMQFKEIENLQVKDMRTKSAMKVWWIRRRS